MKNLFTFILTFILVGVFSNAYANILSVSDVSKAEVESRISELVQQKLKLLYPESTYRYEIEIKRVPSKLEINSKKEIEEISFVNTSLPKGYERVKIHLSSSDQLNGYASLAQVHIKLWQKLPLLTTNKANGEALSQDDFRTDWYEITKLSGYFVTNYEQIRKDQVLSRMLNAGQPIRDIDLTAKPVIEAGDPIIVIMQKDGFQIQFTCIARQGGAIGEHIRCYSEDNRKTYSATILDRNKALWKATF